MRTLLCVAVVGAAIGCSGATSTTEAPPQLPKIDAAAILERTRSMSADEYEGRAPGSKGEQLTVSYLEGEFRKLGLEPGNPDGTYIQKVPLVGITGRQARPLTVTKGAARQTFTWSDDVVAWTKHVADGAAVSDSELVTP